MFIWTFVSKRPRDVPLTVMCQPIRIGHFRMHFASVSKRVLERGHSYENVFCLQVHFLPNETHFPMKSFAEGLDRFETEARVCLWSSQFDDS